MPAREMADRKRRMANELNRFIALKKQYSSTEDGRNELMAGAAPAAGQQEGISVGYDGELLVCSMQAACSKRRQIHGVACLKQLSTGCSL